MKALKFVPSTSDGLPTKRKGVQHACENCRKRKKRCHHRPEGGSIMEPNAVASSSTTMSHCDPHDIRFQVPASATRDDSSTSGDCWGERSILGPGGQRRIKKKDSYDSRFVGAMNPEGIFLSVASPGAASDLDDSGRIGVWLSGEVSSQRLSRYRLINGDQGPNSILHKILIPLVKEQCLSLLPAADDFDALKHIFFARIHPIFPVIDKQAFLSLQPDDPSMTLLSQAISLAASTDPQAPPHLRLSTDGPISQQDFSQRLSEAMKLSINVGLTKNRSCIVQACALLSLFIPMSDGGDLASQFSSLAVHHVHTMGIHLQRRDASQEDSFAETLFMAIWALDKLNSSIYGRPILMHDRDISRNIESCIERQAPCFQLFLRVVRLIEEMMYLYRPQNENNNMRTLADFPTFEDLLVRSKAAAVEMPLLATIEILYFAMAILSCRTKSTDEPRKSSTLYARQSQAASRITAIVSEEFHNQLSMIPTVPYAVSLSLSVAYHELRHTKVPMCRARARKQLQENCALLRDLGSSFNSASMMAELGERVIQEMERVMSTMTTAPAPTPANMSEQSCEPDGEPSRQNRAVPTQPTPQMAFPITAQGSLEDSVVNSPPQFDVFSYFDPNFDLGAMDAAFEGNLDLSFPAHPAIIY